MIIFAYFVSGVVTKFGELISMGLCKVLFWISIFFLFSANSSGGDKRIQSNDQELLAFIEITNQMRMGIYFQNGWKTMKINDRISEIGSGVRYVSLPVQIQQELELCFSGERCPKSIVVDWSVEIDDKNNADIYAIQVSKKYVVVSQKIYPYYAFLFVDMTTGQVHNVGKFERILAFSSEFSGIFYSDRSVHDQSCIVKFYSLDGKESFLPLKISGHIEDMRVVGDKLQLLINRGAKVSASPIDKIMGVIGHPKSYYIWSLVEVSLKDLNVQEHTFEGKSANSWGRFICKWCYRD